MTGTPERSMETRCKETPRPDTDPKGPQSPKGRRVRKRPECRGTEDFWLVVGWRNPNCGQPVRKTVLFSGNYPKVPYLSTEARSRTLHTHVSEAHLEEVRETGPDVPVSSPTRSPFTVTPLRGASGETDTGDGTSSHTGRRDPLHPRPGPVVPPEAGGVDVVLVVAVTVA